MASPDNVVPIGARPPQTIVGRLADGYANLMSRLGVPGFDRNTAGRYFTMPLSQAEIEAAYRSSWLTRKVHDLVPFEMTRAGRDWQAEADQIEALEATETALGAWNKLCVALTTARLHGGSAIIMGVLGAGGPNTELNPESVRKGALRYLYVASRHHLNAPYGFEIDPESPYFGAPKMYQLRGARGNQVDIHPSRIIPFHGSPLPPASVSVSQLDQFWGDPQLMSIKGAIDNSEASQAAVATLLHELKQDVISIPGLTEQIATENAEATVGARIQAINTFKSMFNTILLDAGDGSSEHSGEKWETRQINFSQHPELLRAFLGIVAGAVDIPVTRLMGESPGGLQSTGKGEQDDFNRMIAARQGFELAPALARLDDVLIRSVLGERPPKIYYEFAPLQEADRKEAAEIEKLEAETVDIYTRTAHIPSAEMAKAVANRMKESGRWPGLDVTDAEIEANVEEKEAAEAEAAEQERQAANENQVQQMERRGQVTRDDAMTLLTDASPRSLYVSRKLLNAAELVKWAKAQGFTTTQPPEDMHVTIMFSRTPVDWIKAGGDGWGGDENGELRVAPGGPRLVEKLCDKGAVVHLFASSALTWRHEEIKRAGASPSHDEFQPHVTITYQAPEGLDLRTVEPYRGALRFGPEIFAEVVDDWETTITER